MSSDVVLCNKAYRAGHPLNLYRISLNYIRPNTVAIPATWKDFSPNRLIQELLLTLVDTLERSNPRSNELAIQELTELMNIQSEHITGGLELYKGILLSTHYNSEFIALSTSILESEARATAAYDYISLEAGQISSNLLFMLSKSITALEAMLDWVNAFSVVYSTGTDGKLLQGHKWIQWDEEKIKKLLT